MLSKELNDYKKMTYTQEKMCMRSFNWNYMKTFNKIGSTEEEIQKNKHAFYYCFCTSWYRLKVLNEEEARYIAMHETPVDQKYSLYEQTCSNENGELTVWRIYPIFGEGTVLLSGFNYKLESLPRLMKEDLEIKWEVNYFTSNRQFDLLESLIDFELINGDEYITLINDDARIKIGDRKLADQIKSNVIMKGINFNQRPTPVARWSPEPHAKIPLNACGNWWWL